MNQHTFNAQPWGDCNFAKRTPTTLGTMNGLNGGPQCRRVGVARALRIAHCRIARKRLSPPTQQYVSAPGPGRCSVFGAVETRYPRLVLCPDAERPPHLAACCGGGLDLLDLKVIETQRKRANTCSGLYHFSVTIGRSISLIRGPDRRLGAVETADNGSPDTLRKSASKKKLRAICSPCL